MENFKKDIDSNTIIVGDFNTPLSTMHRSSKQNINKDIVELNDALDLMDLIDIYRNFHSKDHILFKCTRNIYFQRDHMIGCKTSLNKLKKIGIISSIFSDHKGLKLGTNLKEKTQEHSNSWRLNSMLLNNEWVNTEMKKESKSLWKQMKMNSQQPKTYGTQRRQS